MKKLFLCLLLIVPVSFAISQNVGIGTNNPNPCAQLDVSSINKGFLPPRLTAAQRDVIINPVAGLMIFCTDCDSSGQPQFYNGTRWANMLGGLASSPLLDTASKLFIIRHPANSTDNLVAIFDWKNAGFVFNYYGNLDDSSHISKINAVVFYDKAHLDTTYNFTLDNSGRINTFYRKINNNYDSTIVKVSYDDSLIFLRVFQVEPNTQALTLRDIITLNTHTDTSLSRMMNARAPNLTNIGNLIGATSAVAYFVCVTTAIGTAPAWVPWVLLTGVAGGIILPAIHGSALDMILQPLNNISNSLYSSANAAEVDQMPSGYSDLPNPSDDVNSISSVNMNDYAFNIAWNGCVHTFTYGGSYEISGTGYNLTAMYTPSINGDAIFLNQDGTGYANNRTYDRYNIRWTGNPWDFGGRVTITYTDVLSPSFADWYQSHYSFYCY